MTTKWSAKEATRHLTELKNPFESLAKRPALPNLVNKVKEMVTRNKGVEKA